VGEIGALDIANWAIENVLPCMLALLCLIGLNSLLLSAVVKSIDCASVGVYGFFGFI
jgi:hypothetical protein